MAETLNSYQAYMQPQRYNNQESHDNSFVTALCFMLHPASFGGTVKIEHAFRLFEYIRWFQ